MGQEAVAITDHGNVAGTYAFTKSCRAAGVKPILGMEAYYTVNDRSAKEKDEDGNNYYHLVLLAKNNQGLKNLFAISTRAFTEGMYYKPRADDALLAEHAEGIIATSACLGSRASRLILDNRVKEAERLILHHDSMFEDFLIEVQLHEDKEQQTVNKALIEIAQRHNLPLVLTNDCLLPGQPIMTSAGAKPVEDIEAGDTVLTHTGSYHDVVVPVSRHVDDDIAVIHLQQTGEQQDVRLTRNHPVLVSDEHGNIEWKNAGDLEAGDYATFPRQKLETQHVPYYESFNGHLVREMMELDEALAWLLGWFTAEGSTWLEGTASSRARRGFNFALSLEEQEVADRIQQVIESKFEYKPKVHVRSNWIEVRGYSSRIARTLSELCGIGSKKKFIHPIIQKSNHLETYLSALFQGDGTSTRTSQLATASYTLAFGVKQALASIGYWGCVSHIERKCQTGTFDQWLISWTPEIKQPRWLVFDDYLARKITQVRYEHYVGPVYNFEVDTDETYVTNICVHNCHYTHEHQKDLHEQTLCMSTNAKMSDPPWDPERKVSGGGGKTRFSFGDIDVHTAHKQWMWERAQKQGIPYEAIKNTWHVAQMVDDSSYFADRINRYPTYQKLPEGLPPWEALENISKQMLMQKMGGRPPQQYIDRINHELRTVKRMGFYHYLLIVMEFMQNAQSEGILTGPGRGSAAGSLLAYALGITQVDPIKYGLVFERFLNEGRAATPVLLDREMIKQIEAAPTMENGHCAVDCTCPLHGHHDH